MTVESLGTTKEHKVEARSWFFWNEGETEEAKEEQAEIEDAWGGAYDMLRAESEGQ